MWIGRPTEVREAIDGFYAELRATEHLGEILDNVDVTAADDDGEEVDLAALRQQVEDAPVVRLVNLMIAEAIDQRASDIHVEPMRDRVTVRFRIDGVLHEVMKPPKNMQMAIISRIKVLADLDIAIRLLPQDGRLTVHLPDREVDLRVSTLPTVARREGRDAPVRQGRVRAPDRQPRPRGRRRCDAFRRVIRQPYGMILISGPTGSGKTTTLYSALQDIRSVHRNLVTVEDPIEYHIDAVTQVHANAKVGLTFARALRSILRQDPDVIMIGEIRDTETADIAVKSALTGHLVFSTVHANDAPGTLTRLDRHGPAPLPRGLGHVAGDGAAPRAPHLRALQGAVHARARAARLARRGRRRCCAAAGSCAGAAASHCKQTGYTGRTALFEVLELNRDIRRMVLDGLNEDEIRKRALADGLRDAAQGRHPQDPRRRRRRSTKCAPPRSGTPTDAELLLPRARRQRPGPRGHRGRRRPRTRCCARWPACS